MDLHAIELDVLGSGLGVLSAGLSLRLCVTRLALCRSGLTSKERLLVCVAWLPKATVQAAVGGAALDLVLDEQYGPEAERCARLVLTLSVLVILLTAPVGAIGIAVLGPKCLEYDGLPPPEGASQSSSTLPADGGPTCPQHVGACSKDGGADAGASPPKGAYSSTTERVDATTRT